jgi:hypothetical protein
MTSNDACSISMFQKMERMNIVLMTKSDWLIRRHCQRKLPTLARLLTIKHTSRVVGLLTWIKQTVLLKHKYTRRNQFTISQRRRTKTMKSDENPLFCYETERLDRYNGLSVMNCQRESFLSVPCNTGSSGLTACRYGNFRALYFGYYEHMYTTTKWRGIDTYPNKIGK